MKLTKLNEWGLRPALFGVGKSYGVTSGMKYDDFTPSSSEYLRMLSRAEKLSGKDGGHNEFLIFLKTWWEVTGSLKWWKQMDQYKVAVRDLSESTMHTIMNDHLTPDNFESAFPGMEEWLESINKEIDSKNFEAVTDMLPCSFLQTRVVTMNYMNIRNIIAQRQSHKLKQWHIFCDELKKQVNHPQFL